MMAIDIAGYLAKIQKLYASGQTTEHSFRPALNELFDSITEGVAAVNEPRAVKVGRPDFVILRGPITVGHCEAKDLGLDVHPRAMRDANKAQFERYVRALPNLLYTNGLDFLFYKNGELVRDLSIADLLLGIQPKPDQFAALANQLKDFAAERLQTITSAETLAEMMAGKAVLIKDILFNTLKEDTDLRSELAQQYRAFQDQLIHDLGIGEFADIYSETVAYGMFAARLHDETLRDFSREEALKLLPKSNPFLRNLFTFVAGPNLDDAIRRTIDELAEIFQATDLQKLFEDFGKFTQRNDPFIHFYETFLAQYNPSKRKARGVWYTPEPVVNFIVRAVDKILITEFGLIDGLADTSKVTVNWDTGQTFKGKPVTVRKEVHRVQILDPAAGTGTFLAEAIKQIAPRIQNVAPGQWNSYVEKELIPRLHGFELLMASYAMCHMKLDMMLTQMGYQPTSDGPPRLSVYLTNSLEEGDRANQTLPFAQWLSNEAKEANAVKRDMPIMVLIGNPPYSGHSSNKSTWIEGLMEAYKKSPELKRPAQAKWLSDDYVKFLRFAEFMIEKNGEGVLGFITNHGYLDNPTFLDMRRHLMETFDKIFIFDLHGSTKKKETTPDGKPDANIFDIQQGVAIIVAMKRTGNKKAIARVFHKDIWGSRAEKYSWLWSNDVGHVDVKDISPQNRPWRFIPRDDSLSKKYEEGFGVPELFSLNGRPAPGMVSTQDDFAVSWSPTDAIKKIDKFLNTATEAEARDLFKLCTQSQWNYEKAKENLAKGKWKDKIISFSYRPFDVRTTIYDSNVSVHLRERASRHMLAGPNIGLAFNRTVEQDRGFTDVFVFKGPIQHHSLSIKEVNYLAPLYLYPSEVDLDRSRVVNMDQSIRSRIEAIAMAEDRKCPDELEIFDYVYGALHCSNYRKVFEAFLKSDFPRVPYPKSAEIFWHISGKGRELRRLHLMEDESLEKTPYLFSGTGNSVVEKTKFVPVEDKNGEIFGSIFINNDQQFEHVPETAWDCFIGGYQPAQKWLKDRKNRILTFEDVRQYQRIIKILSETSRITKVLEIPL